jgi:proteasome accessory factor C
MSAQPHLLRLFSLIRLLNQRPGLTLAQAAQTLDTSSRTVYRYLETLEDLGYCIDKDDYDRLMRLWDLWLYRGYDLKF